MQSNFEPIYRDFTLTKTSVTAAGKFLQGLASSGGSITSMFSLSNGFPVDKAQYYSTFYRLKFLKQENLDRFHSLGFQTNDIPRIADVSISCITPSKYKGIEDYDLLTLDSI